MFLNISSRAIGFFGSTYAIRCMEPVNLGISALVQTTVTQASLIYDSGLNTTGVRLISSDKATATSTATTIITFRLSIALLVSVIWCAGVFLFVPSEHQFVWFLGIPALFIAAANPTFIFQGIEKLPVMAAITTLGVLLSTAAYFIFFQPHMDLGADLIVIVSVGFVTTILGWIAYFRLYREWPVARLNWQHLKSMLHESRELWIIAVIGTVYPATQIFMIASILGFHASGIYRSALVFAAVFDILFSNISSLLLPRVIVWRKQGILFMWQRLNRLTIILGLILLPIALVVEYAAPLVFNLLLGEAFKESVTIFQIILVGKLTVCLGLGYSYGLVALQSNSHLLRIYMFVAIMSVSISAWLIPLYGLYGAAISVLLTDLFFPIACYIMLRITVVKPATF